MFKPYRGTDVAPDYARIRGIWMTAHRRPAVPGFLPAGISIERLGWGDTYAGDLQDFTQEEQAILITTLDDEA